LRRFLTKILELIPKNKKRKLPFVFGISLLNSLLDFISIALLTPYLLLLFDKKKSIEFISHHFSIALNEQDIIWSLLILILFFALKNYIQSKIIFKQSQYVYGIASDISKQLIKKYFAGNFLKQVQQDKGEIVRDFQQLPMLFATFILLSLYYIISESIFIFTILCAGAYFHPYAALLSICIVALGTLILLKVRHQKIRILNKEITQSYKESLNQIMNAFSGFLQIKSAKAEKHFTRKFASANKKHYDLLSSLSVYKQLSTRYFEVFAVLVVSLIILYTQMNSNLSVNTIVLTFLISAVIKLIPSFNKIINSIIDIQSNKHTVDILSKYNLFHENKEPITKIDFQKAIEIKNVSFAYHDKKWVLENVSFSLAKGDFIAISGKSGIGKTTLLQLLTGLLKPTKGCVTIDNEEITNSFFLDFASMVPQQPFLFYGTLLENIVMKKGGEIDTEFILSMIEKFGLHEWFLTLENGLDSILNLDSKAISGGQKQRIALIRALYQKPKLLLLDEVTNQLDSDTELKVLSYLQRLSHHEGVTIIAVSHHQQVSRFATHTIDLSKNGTDV